MKVISKKWAVPLAALILTLTIAGAAFAATGSPSTDTIVVGGTQTTTAPQAGTYCGGERGWGGQRTDETALTGDELTKVKNAALAEIGSDATVVRAETDADGKAKYEVHAIKADGTHVTVYVDQNFKVTSVETCSGPGGDGNFRGRGMRGDETPLTGDTLTAVKNAALAAVGTGSTLIWATTEDDNSDSNVKYEAMVRKADGTCVIVYLDANYKVVEQVSAPLGGGRRGAGPGGDGRGGCRGMGPQGTTPTTAPSTTGGTINFQ